jgi:uncharacterized BrkB/YihY/UPF0761 family membrane protein
MALQENRHRGQRGLRLHSLVDPLRQTVVSWLDHEGPRRAASLSFYSLLSLAPLVILTIAIASLAFGRLEAQAVLIDEVRNLMGEAGANAVQMVIDAERELERSIADPIAQNISDVLELESQELARTTRAQRGFEAVSRWLARPIPSLCSFSSSVGSA